MKCFLPSPGTPTLFAPAEPNRASENADPKLPSLDKTLSRNGAFTPSEIRRRESSQNFLNLVPFSSDPFFFFLDEKRVVQIMKQEAIEKHLTATGLRHRAASPARKILYGMRTVSMTWITPLLARMSVFMTFAAPIVTFPLFTLIMMSLPFTVLTVDVFTSSAITLPDTTW